MPPIDTGSFFMEYLGLYKISTKMFFLQAFEV